MKREVVHQMSSDILNTWTATAVSYTHLDVYKRQVVDGFNVRRDFDLDELKEQIKAKGVLNPLTVIAFKDDEGNEKYKWVDGERRYLSLIHI